MSRFRDYIRISKVGGLARRYFIMNGFDGALTTLGVVLGSWFGGVQDPRIVFGLGLSTGIAMAVSGAWGAMISERAERLKSKKDLECSSETCNLIMDFYLLRWSTTPAGRCEL